MQNCIHYFRWTAGLKVVTNSFLTGTKNDKYGINTLDYQCLLSVDAKLLGATCSRVFFNVPQRPAKVFYSMISLFVTIMPVVPVSAIPNISPVSGTSTHPLISRHGFSKTRSTLICHTTPLKSSMAAALPSSVLPAL